MFALAIINRNDSSVHMGYMTGTALTMIGPGLGRALIIFGSVPFIVSVNIVYYVAEILAFLFFDK
ncbi:MAG: hypothetical protein ABI288_07795 [Ginsengibacter sp.]